jgi:hypothetical protein
MNRIVVKSVFGGVAPAPPVITENESNLVPVLLLVAIVGIGVLIYIEYQRPPIIMRKAEAL